MSRAAFTLIEVVVALALGALLLAGVTSLTVHGYRISQTLRSDEERRDARRLPLQLLEDDLRAAATTGSITLRDGALVITTLNDLLPERDAARHGIEVRYHNGRREVGAALIRAQRALDVDAPWGAEVALAAPLRSAEFAVFDGAGWFDAWPLPVGRTPLAVRLVVEFDEDQTEETIVPLQPRRWSSHAR